MKSFGIQFELEENTVKKQNRKNGLKVCIVITGISNCPRSVKFIGLVIQRMLKEKFVTDHSEHDRQNNS
jgi:hypothetical protein